VSLIVSIDEQIFIEKYFLQRITYAAIVQSYQQTAKGNKMLKVTFYVYSKILNKEFRNTEIHSSMANANLRALALNWQIESVEQMK
jgi:hypothetical protein